MPKLFLALVGLALVVASRAVPLQNHFKDASLKSLGQSELDAVNAAVKALPEHPILAQVLAGVRHQELSLYLKLGKYIKDYRDDLDKLTIHAARGFLLLVSNGQITCSATTGKKALLSAFLSPFSTPTSTSSVATCTFEALPSTRKPTAWTTTTS